MLNLITLLPSTFIYDMIACAQLIKSDQKHLFLKLISSVINYIAFGSQEPHLFKFCRISLEEITQNSAIFSKPTQGSFTNFHFSYS